MACRQQFGLNCHVAFHYAVCVCARMYPFDIFFGLFLFFCLAVFSACLLRYRRHMYVLYIYMFTHHSVRCQHILTENLLTELIVLVY
jgi:hypothetical protein